MTDSLLAVNFTSVVPYSPRVNAIVCYFCVTCSLKPFTLMSKMTRTSLALFLLLLPFWATICSATLTQDLLASIPSGSEFNKDASNLRQRVASVSQTVDSAFSSLGNNARALKRAQAACKIVTALFPDDVVAARGANQTQYESEVEFNWYVLL